MPLFQYQAIAEDGKKCKGVIDADSLFMAKERLRKQKVFITAIEGISSQKTAHTSRAFLNETQLLDFTRELAQLLKAGLPLYESLVTIEEKHKQGKAHILYADLCDLLKSGSSLSSALTIS